MPSGLPNLPSDALASYLFSIEIDSIEIAQFAEVSGLASRSMSSSSRRTRATGSSSSTSRRGR